jgi:hypothetical protein
VGTFFPVLYLLVMCVGVHLALRDQLVPDLPLEPSFSYVYEGCITWAFVLLSTFAVYDFRINAFLLVPLYLGGIFSETKALLAITAERIEIDEEFIKMAMRCKMFSHTLFAIVLMCFSYVFHKNQVQLLLAQFVSNRA